MAYTSITSNPSLSGAGIADVEAGFITGVGINWRSSLAPIRTLEGAQRVADIPKGIITVQCLVKPDGSGALSAINSTTVTTVIVNGAEYNNTYHTGGQIATREFGEGLKSLTLTKIFSVFGECAEAPA